MDQEGLGWGVSLGLGNEIPEQNKPWIINKLQRYHQRELE